MQKRDQCSVEWNITSEEVILIASATSDVSKFSMSMKVSVIELSTKAAMIKFHFLI
jgi:hypothetical protein